MMTKFIIQNIYSVIFYQLILSTNKYVLFVLYKPNQFDKCNFY